MAHFNDRVEVREIVPCSDTQTGYPGAYAAVIRQYSESLSSAEYEHVSTPIANTVDFSVRNLPKEKGVGVLVSNWHIKDDGLVYQFGEHTSKVVAIQGNVVTTTSGSLYVLTNRDPKIKEAMNLILAAYRSNSPQEYMNPHSYENRTFQYRSTEPLHWTMVPFLFAAEMLVYGELKPYAEEIKARLIRLANSDSMVSDVICPKNLVRSSYVP